MSARGPLPIVAAALAIALVAAGCASIPSSGRAHKVPQVESTERAGSKVQVYAQPPTGGETPVQIVYGFLEAATSDELGFPIARQYLTPDVRSQWRPARDVVVYEGESPGEDDSEPYRVTLVGREVARVDAEGVYHAAKTDTRLSEEFELLPVEGEWRISKLPAALYVSQFDFARVYRPVNLYFFDNDLKNLVPDPVYVPDRPEVETLVVQRLMEGPTSWLNPIVRSALPEGLSLPRDTVSVEGQVAHVGLDRAMLHLGSEQRERLLAQLVFTLTQLPGVAAVEVTAGGEPLVAARAQPQDRESWGSFPSNSDDAEPVAYFIRDRRLYTLADSEPQPVQGPFGELSPALRSAGIAHDRSLAAGVAEGGTSLHIAGLVPDTGYEGPVLEGHSLSTPSWDGYGRVWVVDRAPTGSTVWRVDSRNTTTTPVEVEGLASTVQIETLRIAREGSRAALLVRDGDQHKILLGRVEGGSAGEPVRITQPRQVTGRFVEVKDLAWADSDRLAVLGKELKGPMQPYVVSLDGSAVDPKGQVGDVTSLAAAHGKPILVGAGGAIWRQSRGPGWAVIVETGAMPVYPG